MIPYNSYMFVLPFKPVSWAAAKVTRNGAYSPRRKEKQLAQLFFKQTYKGIAIGNYCTIKLLFIFPVPNSFSKNKRQMALEGKIFPTSHDCTNCQKFYEDCLKKIVITDDRNVVEISSKKIYGDKGRVKIEINVIDN